MNDRARGRAETVAEALWGATQSRSRGAQRTRGARRLVMTAEPQLVHHVATGAPVGVEVWVELTVDGVVQDIDDHRVFINPPTRVVTAEAVLDAAGNVTTPRQYLDDPGAALWEALWQQVDSHPSPETKARPRKVAR